MMHRADSPIGHIAMAFIGVPMSNLVSPIPSVVYYVLNDIDLTFSLLFPTLMALNWTLGG